MIDRISVTSSYSSVDTASFAGARAASSDNPLLSTMAAARAQLSTLQLLADKWLASAQQRQAVAREARDFAATVGDITRRAIRDATPQRLPQALREFAVRHELLSSRDANGAFDAQQLQRIESQLQALASNDGASTTREQIELKRFVSNYDNTLTLYNAVISKLGEITKKIVNSI